jgi:hypothetical protein
MRAHGAQREEQITEKCLISLGVTKTQQSVRDFRVAKDTCRPLVNHHERPFGPGGPSNFTLCACGFRRFSRDR